MCKFNLSDFHETINLLSQEEATRIFDSHLFIDRFRTIHEDVYIRLLTEYNSEPSQNTSIQKAHAQIAKYLSVHTHELNILKHNRSNSKNDHGKETECQNWMIVSND